MAVNFQMREDKVTSFICFYSYFYSTTRESYFRSNSKMQKTISVDVSINAYHD